LVLDSVDPGDDPTALREITAFWMAEQLGLPFNHLRFVQVAINGINNSTRGIPIFTERQVPMLNFFSTSFQMTQAANFLKSLICLK